EIAGQINTVSPAGPTATTRKLKRPNGDDSTSNDIDIPLYSVDAMVRRATALQLTPEARRAAGDSD
ncbi:MAG: hypothetical protein KJO82_09470, partial [Gammaproteobacteria bacterium]|nr:hypothetical protein [Gammaproteobacteria bacterium]